MVVLDRGQTFDHWNFAKAGKKAGGRVYIAVANSGEVTVHEGYLTHREAAKAKASKGKAADAADAKAPAKPKSPITSGMRNYLDLHRHAAVRLALIANPNAALRLLLVACRCRKRQLVGQARPAAQRGQGHRRQRRSFARTDRLREGAGESEGAARAFKARKTGGALCARRCGRQPDGASVCPAGLS